MKKVMLFLWFGDEKPPYIQWTLYNFRQMNPGWEIRYIEYSNEQLLNYKDQDDPVLAATSPNKCFSYWVDDYKKKYLTMHKEEFVIYCDLDCFPIAPFDNFIMPNDDNLPKWVMKTYCPNQHICPAILGTCGSVIEGKLLFKEDLWCLCNNKALAFRQFLQIHRGMTSDDTVILHRGMLLNKKDLPIYEQRLNNFHNMNLTLGDNFCLPQFTPIEHYYSYERDKLNKGAIE